MYITHRSADRCSIETASGPSMMGSKKTDRRFSLESSGYQLETEAKPRNSSLRRSSEGRSFQNPDETHLELLEHSVLRRFMTIEEEGLVRPDVSAARATSFKTHNKTFHKLFPEIPKTEDLEHMLSCGLQKEVIYHGKMYLSSHYICFHSSVLLKDTKVMIQASSVQSIKKKHTAKIVPNAIAVITTDTHKYVFVSLLNREVCFRLLQSLCPQLQTESSSRKSSTEHTPDMDMDTISSQSSLEENHWSLQPEEESSTPHGEASRKPHNTAVSWVTMVMEKVSAALSSNETRSLEKLLLFYVILVILLLLSSGYIGLKIVALEQQLSILGSMPEFSVHRENQET